MPTRTFRDIVAWQRAMELAQWVYGFVGELPDAERFGLSMQMRRAAVSIASNIAEGYGRHSRSEFVRFLRIARGSLCELSTQIELAGALFACVPSAELVGLVDEVDRVTNALIRSLLDRLEQER